MCLRNRIKDPKTVIRIGFAALALANLSMWLLHRVLPNFSEKVGDGVIGFLYGVAISTLLLGIWRNGRRPSSPGAGSCA